MPADSVTRNTLSVFMFVCKCSVVTPPSSLAATLVIKYTILVPSLHGYWRRRKTEAAGKQGEEERAGQRSLTCEQKCGRPEIKREGGMENRQTQLLS